MATQTIEFNYTTGQTVTAKLFALNSDTVVASVSATEATNRKSIYTAAFTDVPAGTYRIVLFIGSTGVATAFVTLTLTTGLFYAVDRADLVDAPNAAAVTAIQNGLSTFDHAADTVDANLVTVEDTDATDYFTSMIAAIWSYSTRTITGLTQAALALFTNTDTGETSAEAGSVAKLSQDEDQRGQSSW